MAAEIVNLDLHTLTADQQVEELKRQFLRLRGNGAVVRVLAGALPVRQYISMLERGYRVTIEREGDNVFLSFGRTARCRVWDYAAPIRLRATVTAGFIAARRVIA